jgi:hypothetical protein
MPGYAMDIDIIRTYGRSAGSDGNLVRGLTWVRKYR